MVSVDRGGEIEFGQAYGLAHRGFQIPNTFDTRFAIASGTKGLTALTVVSLISDGALRLSTAARSVLGDDLPLIGAGVTVGHLLAHRSGIGDYLDEEAGHELSEYVLTVPAQDLATTGQHLAVLGGHPAKFSAGEGFSYCNSGYVVLALIAERVSGDGGIYSTAADISALWQSLFASKIVPAQWAGEMVRPRSNVPAESMRYGLGFWLGEHDSTVILEGLDAGVSFRSVHDPGSAVTRTVISSSSDGAWPLTQLLGELFAS